MNSIIGSIQKNFSARGTLLNYSIYVQHKGLNKGKIVKSSSPDFVLGLAEMQAKEWEEAWNKIITKESELNKKNENKQLITNKQNEARYRTEDAERAQLRLKGILKETLTVNDEIDWEIIKNHKEFPESPPKKPTIPKLPILDDIGPEPQINENRFQVKISFLDRILSVANKKKQEARVRFQNEHAAWVNAKEQAEDKLAKQLKLHKEACLKLDLYPTAMSEWEARKKIIFRHKIIKTLTLTNTRKTILQNNQMQFLIIINWY